MNDGRNLSARPAASDGSSEQIAAGKSNANDLIEAITEVMARPGADQFERVSVVALLRVIAEQLTPLLSAPMSHLATGEPLFLEHPAATLLSNLANALADLDFAKTDAILKPNCNGAGNTRPWRERERVRVLLETVEILKRVRDYKTRAQAHIRARIDGWRSALATLDHNNPPAAVSPDRWRPMLLDANAFLTDWGTQAASLGWSTIDLFGCPPAFARRLDRDGLLTGLNGRVPDDIRLLVGLTEVRRSLKTCEPFKARSLAAKYAARLLRVFAMLKTKDFTRAVVGLPVFLGADRGSPIDDDER